METPLGDYRLSPAYDLVNSRIHVKDKDLALDDGLLPQNLAKGKIMHQFSLLADQAGISRLSFEAMRQVMLSGSTKVERLIFSSYLDESTRRNYWQSYQGRLRQLMKE